MSRSINFVTARLAPGWPVGPGSRLLALTLLRNDLQDGGSYRIVGDTKVKGTPTNTPVPRRVLLCDQLSGRVVRSVWSDATTGAYNFSNIRQGVFYVISFDHAGAFRAVVADNLVSELMP